MADRTETVVLDFEVDVQDSITSIESLTKANKELREERKKLNLESEAGQKRAKEINAQLDANTKKITDNSSAIEKQRANIGNYKSALDGVHPALGKVGEGLEKGTEGFKAMTMQALRFIATPIGAVLAAIVAVFTLLKSALSQNDALMDKFENITNAVSVVLEVVVARVGKLGEALIALASGNFTEAINKTAQAFGGLGAEIEAATKQQQLFLDASRELEDAQRNLRIEQAKSVNQIKLLDQVSKNANKSFDEREDALKQALSLQKDLIDASEDIARRDLLITARRLRVSKEFQQQSNENFTQYIDRLLSSSALGGKELDKIVDKVVALENARGQSLDFQQKLENDLTKIQNDRAEALKKQNAALKEQEVLERATRRAQKVSDTSTADPLVSAFQDRANVITDINDRLQDDLTDRQRQGELERLQNAKKSAEMAVEVERSKQQLIGSTIGSTAELFKQDTVAHKVLASAQATINTYLAATAAYASGAKINGLFGALSAAAAIAAGLQSVAKINGVEFWTGGYTGPGGKYERKGYVHANEVVWNQEDVNAVGGPAAANALRPTAGYRNTHNGQYFDGGLVTNSISQPINQQLEIANIVKNIPPGELSVVEFHKVDRRVKVKEKRSKL